MSILTSIFSASCSFYSYIPYRSLSVQEQDKERKEKKAAPTTTEGADGTVPPPPPGSDNPAPPETEKPWCTCFG